MNTEKVYLLAMRHIECALRDFLYSHSFLIPDESAYNKSCEVVKAAELEEIIEKLFEDVKR